MGLNVDQGRNADWLREVEAESISKGEVQVKGIRRVRTPAGVRHFGQPIGTVIVRDLIPNVSPSVATGEYARSILIGQHKVVVDTPRYSMLQFEGDPEGRRPVLLDKARGRLVNSVTGMSNESLGRDDRNLDEWRMDWDKDNVETVALMNLPPLAGDTDGDPLNFTGMGQAMYEHPGVRFADWAYEDDEWMKDALDPEERNDLADYDLHDMGITLTHRAKWGDMSKPENLIHPLHQEVLGMGNDLLPYQVKEALAGTFRMHEEWFPGFTDYIVSPDVGVAEAPDNENWYATTWSQDSVTNQSFLTAHNALMRSVPDWESHSLDGDRTYAITSFHSLNFRDAAEHHNMTPAEIHAYGTWVHEFGHAITNRLAAEDPNFNNEVWTVLEEWGLAEKKIIGGEVMWQLDSIAATQALSAYGTTNIRELMAEVWAQYVLDPNPTELTEILGSMFYEALTEHLESKNKTA